VEILLPNGKQETLLTSGPLDAAPGLGNYVEALFKKGSAEFDVRLVQQNGEILEKPLLHVLLVEQTQMKLFKGRTTKAKEDYSSSIWVRDQSISKIVLFLFWIGPVFSENSPKKHMCHFFET
jgi:hypothetical protein